MMKYLLCFLLLLAVAPPVASAQRNSTLENVDTYFSYVYGNEEDMVRVILQNLIIWVRPSDNVRVYAYGCRTLSFGCEEQIRVMVEYIFRESEMQDFNPWLAAAVAWHESRFNPFATTHMETYGIMQFLRRSSWSHGISFVHNERYRENCRNILGSCQREIVSMAIFWLKRTVTFCESSPRGGLRMYNSGRCDGPARYTNAVAGFYRRFLEMSLSEI